jgi:DNA repair protein RecO (recombination protein O)
LLRSELEPAFVLHNRPFRDSSVLLEVFGREHGRVGLVARGARGPRSRWRGMLQPFRPLLISWRMRGELGTLTGAELAEAALMPPASGDALLALFYLNELLLRLTARLDPHREIYGSYAATVALLAGGREIAPALRRFERVLLDALGYGIDLGQDASGAPIVAERSYRYDPARGLAACRPDLADAIAGSSVLALAEDRLDEPRALVDARRLLRNALDVQLEGRPLKTRELLSRLRGRC